jgi:hypothetical protein
MIDSALTHYAAFVSTASFIPENRSLRPGIYLDDAPAAKDVTGTIACGSPL